MFIIVYILRRYMPIYHHFVVQLDVTSSQLLVNDGFFRDSGFRKQLSDTVNSLLDLRVIPIFNENDAVSTRKAPYEVGWFFFNYFIWIISIYLFQNCLILLSITMFPLFFEMIWSKCFSQNSLCFTNNMLIWLT